MTSPGHYREAAKLIVTDHPGRASVTRRHPRGSRLPWAHAHGTPPSPPWPRPCAGPLPARDPDAWYRAAVTRPHTGGEL